MHESFLRCATSRWLFYLLGILALPAAARATPAGLIETFHTSGSVKVRVRAAALLGRLGSAAALDALVAGVNRGPKAVSAAALAALARSADWRALEASTQCLTEVRSSCPKGIARKIAAILWKRSIARHPPFSAARLHVQVTFAAAPEIVHPNRWLRQLNSELLSALAGDNKIFFGRRIVLDPKSDHAGPISGIRLRVTGRLVRLERRKLQGGSYRIGATVRNGSIELVGISGTHVELDEEQGWAEAEDADSFQPRITKLALVDLAGKLARGFEKWARGVPSPPHD